MSVMKSKDGKNLIVDCNCGCDEGLRIKIHPFDDERYSILTYTSGNFYKDQNMSCWRIFKLKCKKIWRILRGKDYCYSEILLTKEEFEELKEYINSVETE